MKHVICYISVFCEEKQSAPFLFIGYKVVGALSSITAWHGGEPGLCRWGNVLLVYVVWEQRDVTDSIDGVYNIIAYVGLVVGSVAGAGVGVGTADGAAVSVSVSVAWLAGTGVGLELAQPIFYGKWERCHVG